MMAEGKLGGYATVNKFGRNPDVDTSAEDIWGGDGFYTGFPDTALERLSIVSTSAADAAAGTGLRTLRVVGLDTNYNIQQEDVTLNGLTPVLTTGFYRRAHTAFGLTAGSGGVNDGTITFSGAVTAANVFLVMIAGTNQTNNSGYTVPAGKTAYLREISSQIFGSNTASINASLWIRSFGGVFRERRPFGVTNAYFWHDSIYGGLVLTEKSDIIVRIHAASGNSSVVTGGYDLILVDN